MIPRQHFETPSKLVLYLYRTAFFEHILESTNNRIREKVPNPDDHLVTIEELFEYQALNHLATSSFLKPDHMPIEKWFKNVNYFAKPLIGKKVDLDIKMVYSRFNFISKYIDTGEKVMVDKMVKKGNRLVKCTKPNSSEPIKIYDMNKKVDGLVNNLNSVFLKFKNPVDRFLTLDESFRKSFSPLDRMRTFMPNKPDKYGQKYQSLVDSDTFVHFFQFDHNAQFSNWKGTSGLLEYMLPEQYRNRGITLCCDNFYFTFENLKLLHSHGISAFGTFRKNRIGKAMGTTLVNTLTKKMKKRDFQRKIDIYECRLNPEVYGQDQFIQFCFFWDRLDKVILFGLNDPRLFGGNHHSQILIGSQKPDIVKCYNEKKAYVDEVDRMMSAYTSVRPYRNGRCIRRFIHNCWDFALNNAFILFRKHYEHPSTENSKYSKLLKDRKLRSVFYYDLLFGLIGFKKVVPDIEPSEVPNCGPFPDKDCDFTSPAQAKRHRTRFVCVKCSKHVCKSHSVPVCHGCYTRSNLPTGHE